MISQEQIDVVRNVATRLAQQAYIADGACDLAMRRQFQLERDALEAALAEIERLRKDGLTWTKEKPTQEGMYWLRIDESSSGRIVEVFRHGDDWYIECAKWVHSERLEDVDYEFAGPIPQPIDALTARGTPAKPSGKICPYCLVGTLQHSGTPSFQNRWTCCECKKHVAL